jgi:hypothetical protein
VRQRAPAIVTVVAAAAVTAVAAGGCTVGSGAGSASGDLFIVGCNPNDNPADLGAAGAPVAFDLSPTFFAGEPVEAPTVGLPNQLNMRMQRNGNRIEISDTLFFDVNNAYEVARCLRGRTVNGMPDWYTLPVTNDDGSTPATNPLWCDPNGSTATDGGAGADGGTGLPRINISTQDFVKSAFLPLFTCNLARVTGDAKINSWIDFQDFGSALQSNLAPDARGPVTTDFKVNFGERLRARFHVELVDDRQVSAVMQRVAVPTNPYIGGTLDGYFDFILDRGRAAQPFP